ncbi:MAG: hypothetical protein LBH42_02675 [Treponema sp.]|jgi:hypothetical protein|nr:hypothetical protein [Treponema sp.]
MSEKNKRFKGIIFLLAFVLVFCLTLKFGNNGRTGTLKETELFPSVASDDSPLIWSDYTVSGGNNERGLPVNRCYYR